MQEGNPQNKVFYWHDTYALVQLYTEMCIQLAQVGAAHLEIHPDDSSEHQRNAWKEKYNYVKKNIVFSNFVIYEQQQQTLFI